MSDHQTCPKCGSLVIPGHRLCLKCGTAVGPGSAVSRAPHQEEPAGSGIVGKAIVAVLVLGIVIGIGWWGYSALTKAPPDPALAYPTSRTALVRQFFTDVAGNSDADLHHAFLLLALPVRHQHAKHEGEVWQRLSNLNSYLTGLFGPQWISDLVVQPSASKTAGANVYVAQIQTEKFHLNLQPQPLRPDDPQNDGRTHYGIAHIAEFTLQGGARAQQAAGVSAILGGLVGATGAANSVSSISAAYGPHGKETPSELKQRLLPIVENPQAGAGLRDCIYQLWPVRNDPTVRMVLKRILHNRAYPGQARQAASGVYHGNAMPELLINAGVTHIH